MSINVDVHFTILDLPMDLNGPSPPPMCSTTVQVSSDLGKLKFSSREGRSSRLAELLNLLTHQHGHWTLSGKMMID